MVFIICIGKLFILLNPLLQFLKGGEFLFRAVEGQELDFYIFTVDVAFQAKDIGLLRGILLLPWAFCRYW
jgi:hypothetical protein